MNDTDVLEEIAWLAHNGLNIIKSDVSEPQFCVEPILQKIGYLCSSEIRRINGDRIVVDQPEDWLRL